MDYDLPELIVMGSVDVWRRDPHQMANNWPFRLPSLFTQDKPMLGCLFRKSVISLDFRSDCEQL